MGEGARGRERRRERGKGMRCMGVGWAIERAREVGVGRRVRIGVL